MGDAALASLRLDLGAGLVTPAVAQAMGAGTGKRKRTDPRVSALEAAVARLEAHCEAQVNSASASVEILHSPAALVENGASCMVHRLRDTGDTTLCGWRCVANGSCIGDALFVEESDLAQRPWWMLCERCLGTERELGRLDAAEGDDCLSD